MLRDVDGKELSKNTSGVEHYFRLIANGARPMPQVSIRGKISVKSATDYRAYFIMSHYTS